MYENNKEKEKVTGVIPYMTTGRLGRNAYTIVVTNRRLIFAKYSTKLVKEEQKELKTKVREDFLVDGRLRFLPDSVFMKDIMKWNQMKYYKRAMITTKLDQNRLDPLR